MSTEDDFTCHVCTDDRKFGKFYYLCTLCDLFFHIECASLSPEISHPCHPRHPLKFFQGGSNCTCTLCGKDISDKNYYHCSICSFTVDLRCVKNPPPLALVSPKTHKHELGLLPRLMSFTCNACGKQGHHSPYVCIQCNFMVHVFCIDLPGVIWINRHDHLISHTYDLNLKNLAMECGVCRQTIDSSYGAYSCLECKNYVVHSRCATKRHIWDGRDLEGEPEETEDVAPFKENTGQAKDESGSISVMPNECEVWRLKGNEAYKNGDMRNAEDCYTYGINSSLQPLAMCYGNRAAARFSLGILREAIIDCEVAASLDPSYIKAHMRVANCHLVLGELESAVRYFNKCIKSASILDRRTAIEGLQQVQKVADYTSSASVFLEKRTPDGASDALVSIASALLISSCSDELLQMKAEALFMRRHYNEVIELCENTLQTAQKNFVSAGNVEQLPTVWRWKMISMSHFYLGNLESALDILEKLQQVGSSRNENQEECHESPSSLMATISELVRYKNAGNEAVRAGKYMEAVEQYTGALSKNVDSRPFAAICFCNRAVANQALNQIADAISDCSLAMALDEKNYTKAVSRRATLHEMIRDYDQAASDLQRLVDILVKQNNEKTKTPDTSADCATSMEELNEARQRLSLMEKKSKEGIPLDFLLIMGVKASDTAADIKKAYKKAALRHHPDKAAKILVRSESEGPRLREILEEVHKGAERLFKMIGEAYSVLSDPTQRFAYKR